RQLERLELQLQHGRRQLGQLGPERRAESPGLRERFAQRELTAQGPAADERRRQRDLAQEPLASLRPAEQPFDEDRERASQSELVPDRLGKLERLDDLGRGPSPPHSPAVPSSRQAPGAPPVRPQSFGYRAAPRPRSPPAPRPCPPPRPGASPRRC